MTKSIMKKSKGTYMASIPQSELVTAMKELNGGAYKLLMYYYSKNDGWVFDDEQIAETLDTSERQVKKFRKELIDKEYLLIQKGQVDVYFIGNLAVEQFKTSDTDEEEVVPKEPLVTRP